MCDNVAELTVGPIVPRDGLQVYTSGNSSDRKCNHGCCYVMHQRVPLYDETSVLTPCQESVVFRPLCKITESAY